MYYNNSGLDPNFFCKPVPQSAAASDISKTWIYVAVAVGAVALAVMGTYIGWK